MVSLVEDGPSCHFGSRPSSFGTTGGMSRGVVTESELAAEDSEGSLLLLLGVVAIFLLGVLAGRCLGRWPKEKPRPSAVLPWERLVRRALAFIGRRRRVSLAFGAYRDHRLRTEVSRPRPKRRARTPGVLHEGFAITGNGPHRRRAGPDHQFG